MSSLELIEVRENFRSTRRANTQNDIIEIASEEEATFKRSPQPSAYPSSPRSLQQTGLPNDTLNINDEGPENSSIEIAASFQNDTIISESSEPLIPRTTGFEFAAKPSAPPTSILLNRSSPIKVLKRSDSGKILEDLLSDDLSSSDVLNSHRNSLCESKEPPTVAALATKWSQLEEQPRADPQIESTIMQDCSQEMASPHLYSQRPKKRTIVIKKTKSFTNEAWIVPTLPNVTADSVPTNIFYNDGSISIRTSNATTSERIEQSGVSASGPTVAKKMCTVFETEVHDKNESVDLDLAGMTDESSIVSDSKNSKPERAVKFQKIGPNPSKNTEIKRIAGCDIPSYFNDSKLTTANRTESQHDNNMTEDRLSTLQRFIVHGKSFTKNESVQEVKRAMANPVNKKIFNSVNKVVKDSETLKKEMILDMDEELLKGFTDREIVLQQELSPTSIIHTHTNKSLIKFRRICSSIYDYKHCIFYPCKTTTVEETIALLFYDSLEFFHKYVTQNATLMAELRRHKSKYNKIILILNEYANFEKSLCNFENRKYKERVESEMNGISGAKQAKRKSKKDLLLQDLQIESKDLEMRLDEIVVCTGIHVFPIASHQEFVVWLKNLITVIGKARYDPLVKHLEWSHINVKSGQNSVDVLSKTLEQLNKVTKAKAQRVVSAYQSFQKLYEDMNKGYLTSGKDGNPLMSGAAENAVLALLTSENPEELIYID